MNVQASDLPPSAAILVSWIFSLPQASLNHNFADGEGVVKSRTYQDVFERGLGLPLLDTVDLEKTN